MGMLLVPRFIWAVSVPDGFFDHSALHFSGRRHRFIPSNAADISLIILDARALDDANNVMSSAYASIAILSPACVGSTATPQPFCPSRY